MNKKRLHKIFIGTFLLLLIVPNIIMFTSFEAGLNDTEKRGSKKIELTKGIQSFISSFKGYYKDHFGLKKTLTQSYIAFKNNVLDESPIPNKVVIGKAKDWYFLGDDFSDAFSGSIGASQYNEKDIKKIVDDIETMSLWLNEQGIKFYLAVPPNKHTVYKDLLPLKYNNTSKYEHALNAIKANTNVSIIDLKRPLLKLRDSLQIYHTTDSHWNDLGAYFGYRIVMNHLKIDFPELEAISLNSFNKKSMMSQHQEMTRMINLTVDEPIIKLEKKSPSNVSVKINTNSFSHFENSDKNLKIYFCRDSFSNAWIKYFNESFGASLYAKTYRINKNQILREKPDIVILEFVERKFDYFVKYKKPILY